MKFEHSKKIQEIVNNLNTAIKSLKLYQEGHKTPEEMLSRLYKFCKELLEEVELIEFEIDHQGLKWEGKLTLSFKDTDQDFLFKLYKDGVRFFSFSYGLDEEELKKFLKLLVKEIPRDHDVATLLWEENFNFIKFSVIEALTTFFKRDSLEEEKFWEEEAENWKNKINDLSISFPKNLSEKFESSESFEINEIKILPTVPFEREREEAMKKLIKNMLDSLNSSKIEIVKSAAKNIKLMKNIIIHQADLGLFNNLLSLLPENSDIKEIRELRSHLLSESTLLELISSLFSMGKPKSEDLAFFTNSLPDDIAPIFLYHIYERKKEVLNNLYQSISLFRPEVFLNFLNLIEPQGIPDIFKNIKIINDSLKLIIFNSKNYISKKEILKRLEKPNLEILKKGLNADEEDLRILSLEKIVRFHYKDLLDDLIKEVEKEDFLKKEMDEKEKWIIVTAVLGKNLLEPFFLSFFERKSHIFTPHLEERKFLAAKALKILGSEKAIIYLQNEAERVTASAKLKEACKKAIEEIKRRSKTS